MGDRKWNEIVLGNGRVLINEVTAACVYEDGTTGSVRGLAFIPHQEPHPIGERVEGMAGRELDETRADVTVVWVHTWDAAKVLNDMTRELLETMTSGLLENFGK